MDVDNLSKMMPGAFPSTPDSPLSRSSLFCLCNCESTNKQYFANENEVSLPATLVNKLRTALNRDSELHEPTPTITTSLVVSGMLSTESPEDNIILDAEEVEDLMKESLSVIQALEKQCAAMKEAFEEVLKQHEEDGDELQQGVLVDVEDTLITDDRIIVLDLDEAMGELDLYEAKA